MPKFNVGITIMAHVATVIEVEAEDEDEAIDKAHSLVLTDNRYIVKDFDGNAVEIVGDDLHTDSIDKGAPDA